MISDFAGSQLLGPVLIMGSPIKQFHFTRMKHFLCMISDFVGSLLLGSVFIKGPPMKQMISPLHDE